MKIKWRSFLDYCIATLLFFLSEGLEFPGSDGLANIPRLYRLLNSQFLANDFAFDSIPIGYWHIYLVSFLSRFLTIECVWNGLGIFGFVLFLYAMKRLTHTVTGRSVPALVFSSLIVGMQNRIFLGHYYLAWPVFSPHYFAIPFILLSLVFLLEQKYWQAFATFFLGAFFHAHIAFCGSLGLCGVFLWLAKGKMKRLAWACLLLLCALSALAVVMLSTQVSPMALQSATRIMAFARSPHHTLIQASDPHFLWAFLLIILYLSVTFKKSTTLNRASMLFAFIVSFHAVLFFLNCSSGLWPILYLMQGVEGGPLLVSVFLVFFVAVIYDLVEKKMFLSGALFLYAPTIMVRGLLALTHRAFAQWDRFNQMKPFRRDSAMFFAGGLLIILVGRVYPHPVMLPHGLGRYSFPLSILVLLALAGIAGALATKVPKKLNGQSHNTLRLLAVMLLLSLVFVKYYDWFAKRTHFYKYTRMGGKHWEEICEYVRNSTSIEAVFIIPPGMEDFQYGTHRAAFVTYKRTPSRLEHLKEWFNRMQLVGAYPPTLSPEQLNEVIATDYLGYKKLSRGQLDQIVMQYPTVRYFITDSRHVLPYPTEYENSLYRLYRLQ
ncbi:MAG: hypothetical protein HY537_16685 [Deltaproteobacteria bacterium]|nr:hypothetical protein [Deltaproteobacteria bacterium]